MDTILPGHVCVHEPEIRLVNQVRRPQSVVGTLTAQAMRRQPAQLLIHHGHELIESLPIAVTPLLQQLRD
jgi:hypothetical protein